MKTFPAAYVLCEKPCVIAFYDSDFEKRRADLAAALKAEGSADARVILQIGFEHESDEPARQLADAVHAFLRELPAARVVVLGNSPAETAKLSSLGLDARFCHQNAFLDERRFRIFPLEKRYDAVYLARIAPFKRHLLLEKIVSPRFLFAGSDFYESERAYVDEVHAKLAAGVFLRRFRGLDVSFVLAPAVCGLALSAREGAMFASAEYFLSGLPVVNTRSVGGREELFPAEFAVDVEPDPDAIAAGIAKWTAAPPDPCAVRAAFLAKGEPHRALFREIFAELADGRRIGRIPHKLGLRTPPGGEFRIRCGQVYLLARRLQSLLRGNR